MRSIAKAGIAGIKKHGSKKSGRMVRKKDLRTVQTSQNLRKELAQEQRKRKKTIRKRTQRKRKRSWNLGKVLQMCTTCGSMLPLNSTY